MVKYFFYLILVVNFTLIDAQYLSNPSFESDTFGMDVVPDGWIKCNSGCTPDIQPDVLNVDLNTSDGSSYLGLILLDPSDGDGPKNEGVSTQLLKPLYKDSVYLLTIDLADAPQAYLGGNIPQRLRISGGNFACSRRDTIAITDSIKNTRWQNYKFLIIPKSDSIDYLKLEIWGDTKTSNGYLLLDNMELHDIHFQNIQRICQGQRKIKYELGSFPCPRTISWTYTGKGITIDDSLSYLLLNIDENATEGNLVLQINTCNGEINPITLPISIDPLPSDAGIISGQEMTCSDRKGGFFIAPVTNSEKYIWNYSGPGAVISGNTDSISIYFSEKNTSGTLKVTPVNRCGNGNPSPPLSIEVNSCDQDVPNTFTPNEDGINDTWVIENLYDNAKLVVLDRFGRVVYTSDNYRNDWNGTDNKGIELPTDTYWYVLTSTLIAKPIKGFVYLKR